METRYQNAREYQKRLTFENGLFYVDKSGILQINKGGKYFMHNQVHSDPYWRDKTIVFVMNMVVQAVSQGEKKKYFLDVNRVLFLSVVIT